MNKKLMKQFEKESGNEHMEFHSGGKWADYVEWLESIVLKTCVSSSNITCTICGTSLELYPDSDTQTYKYQCPIPDCTYNSRSCKECGSKLLEREDYYACSECESYEVKPPVNTYDKPAKRNV